jgi:RNA polymerase sigma-70 factor (ECF subfamily)
MKPAGSSASTEAKRQTDLRLARDTLSGRQDACRRFAERMTCVRRMVALNNAKVGHPLQADEQEDVAQETLVAVLRKLGRYDGTATLETWVARFCFLEFMRYLRDRRLLPRVTREGVEGTELEPQAAAVGSLLDFEQVLQRLDDLDEDLSKVVWLKSSEGLTFEEVGARLGISPNTAKTRYYRGMTTLRRQFSSRPENVGP